MDSNLSLLECPLIDTQLFFMHMPKTAGTTIIQVIEQQFAEKEIARWLYPFRLVDESPDFFEQHRYFHGHVEYSLMRSLLPGQLAVMTILREPVERYLSHFGNHQRVRFDQIPDITLDEFNQLRQTSLTDFVQNPPEILAIIARYFQNLQAKFLASELEGESLKKRNQLIRTGRYVLPTPTFEQAKQRLDQISFVGVTERFQDSLFLMAYTFGWPPVTEYKSFHTAQPRPQQDKLPPDLLQEINTLNQLDQQIYDEGRKLFQRRYEQMEQELLERYGQREQAHLKLPLASDQMVELLQRHYRQRFAEQNPAVPALKLEFNQKISGSNWQTQQQDPVHGGMRWSGPGRCANLYLPLAATSDVWLRFSVVRALTQATLDSLVVKVNDKPIYVKEHFSPQQARIYEGYVSQEVLARQPGCVQVSFEVEKTIRPLDIIAGSEDDRLLGIGLNWVEVEPALPLAQELVRLKKLGHLQDDMIADLNRQLQVAMGQNESARQNRELETKLQTREELLKNTQRELNAIHSSRAWKLAQRFSSIYGTLKRILGR
jgi:hypothetical protein